GFERRVGLGSIRRRLRHEFGECGAEPTPAGSQKCLNESWGFFVPFRVEPKGSIRWRLREVQGNGGTEPIPAGSQTKTTQKIGLCLYPPASNRRVGLGSIL